MSEYHGELEPDVEMLRERYVGRHVAELAGWTITGYWPVVDSDGWIQEFSDGEEREDLVLADLVNGEIVIHEGACDMLVRKPEEGEQ